jgi:transposase
MDNFVMAAPVKKEIKDEIQDKIRNQGLDVASASEQYRVDIKTIYDWLKTGIGDANSLELNCLRKENAQLYRIIGEITAELKTQKK